MYIGLHVKYPLFLSDFNDTLISQQIFRKIVISDFMKIRPVDAELFRADGRRDRRDEATSRFPVYCERV
jgi:hypothetical protein